MTYQGFSSPTIKKKQSTKNVVHMLDQPNVAFGFHSPQMLDVIMSKLDNE